MNISVSEVSFNFSAQTSAAPAGNGLIAVPSSGAVPRGFNVVTQIGGQQVNDMFVDHWILFSVTCEYLWVPI